MKILSVTLASLVFATVAQAQDVPPALIVPSGNVPMRLAAEAFSNLWHKVTSAAPTITTSFAPARSAASLPPAVVFGSESENAEVFRRRLGGSLASNRLKEGGDGYQLVSREEDGRIVLFLIGGRPRAVFYAVYRFFELRADCAYFWDGDRIPKGPAPSLAGLDLTEEPRFDWRGLRYFGHRSLHRFQAEHWTTDDWKREIDWMLKKRLNFFMLRIGQDDFYQKAFPEQCPPPQDPFDPIGGSFRNAYNDRRLPWTLADRAKLRRDIMAYAHQRDLVHPADTGTMTHWYSRTPDSFMKNVQPEFLAGNNITNVNNSKGHPTGLVWDITKDKWLDAYWKVTRADVDNYSGADMFHTIGLSERGYYGEDHRKALELKLYAYRRIISRLRKDFPYSPLLIGGWDFRELTKWRAGEVADFVKTLDPRNTFIFDYISDLPEGKENLFTHWGVVGKFPWMFGIFHAYEAHNDMRGNYREIDERLGIAAADPMCRGLALWPENSHQDTLMLDYFPAIAWDPSQRRVEAFLPGFCRRRYGAKDAARMLPHWKRFLPMLGADSWHLCCGRRLPLYGDYPAVYANVTAHPFFRLDDYRLTHARERVKTLTPLVPELERTASEGAHLGAAETEAFMRRDFLDLSRAALSRLLILDTSRLSVTLAERIACAEGERARCDAAVRATLSSWRMHLNRLADVLSQSPEFSLADSLEQIKRAPMTANPNFAETLWNNANNGYCRAQILEIIRDVARPRFEALAAIIEKALATGDFSRWDEREAEVNELLDARVK